MSHLVLPERPAHPANCRIAWTITMEHNGVVAFEPCLAMTSTQRAIAQRLVEWVSAGARADAERDRKRDQRRREKNHTLTPPGGM